MSICCITENFSDAGPMVQTILVRFISLRIRNAGGEEYAAEHNNSKHDE